MPKLPLIRSASMAKTVWSKNVTKVAKTMAVSANQPRPSGGHGCALDPGDALRASATISVAVGAIAIHSLPWDPSGAGLS